MARSSFHDAHRGQPIAAHQAGPQWTSRVYDPDRIAPVWERVGFESADDALAAARAHVDEAVG